MGLYVISCTDHPDSFELRALTRAAHLAYVQEAAGVKVGGPYLDPVSGQMIGSMMVIEADSLEAAEAFAASDPYAKAGLFFSASITSWRQTAGTVELGAE